MITATATTGTALASTTAASTSAPLATTALPTGSGRTGFIERFHLISGQNFRELGLGVFFQRRDLRFLIVGQVHFLLGKARDQMEPGLSVTTATTTSATSATTASARATLIRLLLTAGRSTAVILLLTVHERNEQPAGEHGGSREADRPMFTNRHKILPGKVCPQNSFCRSDDEPVRRGGFAAMGSLQNCTLTPHEDKTITNRAAVAPFIAASGFCDKITCGKSPKTGISNMRTIRRGLWVCAVVLLATSRTSVFGAGLNEASMLPGNLVKNSSFEDRQTGGPVGFELAGDVEFRYLGDATHGGPWCVGLQSGKDLNGDGQRAGSVSQLVTGLDGSKGRWYRFTIRGLPQENFSVQGDALGMKVEFFAGDSGFDGKVKHLYSLVEQQRKDLTVNGDRHIAGAATWHTYQLDVMLPSPKIDRVKLTVEFTDGNSTTSRTSEFLVTDMSLVKIDGPEPTSVGASRGTDQQPADLVPIGGRWFYKATPEAPTVPALFDSTNADRLIYHDNRWSAPFEGSMSAWLRAGDLDVDGNVVKRDQFIADNVTVRFDSTSMIIHSHGLPNHPTGKFPGENPNYIQEKNSTFYIPLIPRVNPNHIATDTTNTNHALNMGPIGVAANGVVFYNPFDAGSQDASSIMDYCCGHPDQSGTYHYHKYPICINSPWADEGKEHSPLLGWAFDGFPVYGPYVKAGVMAKDASGADGLNEFNLHTDPERGPHYQVTPGKFPYIIGGYWGYVDSRDVHQRGGRGPGPGGVGPQGGQRPGGFGGGGFGGGGGQPGFGGGN